MADTITETAGTTLDVNYAYEKSRDGTFPLKEQYSSKADSRKTWDSGNGTGEIERTYSDIRTITAASGTDDLDMSALTGRDGQTINFEKVRFIYIRNMGLVDVDAPNLLIKAAPSNGWADFFNSATITGNPILLGPTDEYYKSSRQAGIACPTIASVLRFTHDGGSAGDLQYQIIVGGTITP